MTIDSLFSRFEIDRVDFLKMDIEGAEAQVLGGKLGWLDRVQAIKIEAHPPTATVDQCREVLERHSFKCQLDSKHWASIVGVRS
jgi:hypothetical protein